MTSPLAPTSRRAPLWLVEGLDVLRQRRLTVAIVTTVICLTGLALAIFAPGIVAPTAMVGAAFGFAGLLIGASVAIALDGASLLIGGPRHVRAAGGELVGVVRPDAGPRELSALAESVAEACRQDGRLALGIAAAGRDSRPVAMLTDALAVALAQAGVSVLSADLASGRRARDGLLEVMTHDRRLAEVVDFEPGGLAFARLGPGRDLNAAIEQVPAFRGRLPRDLDVLVVALPIAASRPVARAITGLDHVLLVAERDRTSKVDLIAGLQAVTAAGRSAQVVLLDGPTAQWAAAVPPVRVSGPDASAPQPTDVEPSVAEPSVPEVAADPASEEPPVSAVSRDDARDDARDGGSDDVTAEAPPTLASPSVPSHLVPIAGVDPSEPPDGVQLLEGANDAIGPIRDLREPTPSPRPRAVPPPSGLARPSAPETGRTLPSADPGSFGPDDDPLRTTAQLAVLIDHLEARQDDEDSRS